MSTSLLFAKSTILTKTLLFQRPTVTSYGRFTFSHVQVPNQNHTVPLYTDPLYGSQRQLVGTPVGSRVGPRVGSPNWTPQLDLDGPPVGPRVGLPVRPPTGPPFGPSREGRQFFHEH